MIKNEKHIIDINNFQEPGEVECLLASSCGMGKNKKLFTVTKITPPISVHFEIKTGEHKIKAYTLQEAVNLYNEI